MSEKADVVIIGGGIIGLSIAFQLSRRSAAPNTILLERGAGVGAGSTGASSAILRCRYSLPEITELARDGQNAYRNWAEFTQISQPRQQMTQTGVLWLLGHQPDQVGQEVAELNRLGVRSKVLNPNQLAELFPALSDCSIPMDFAGGTEHVCQPFAAAVFEEDGGYADPTAAAEDLVEAGRRGGVDIRMGSPVVDIEVNHNKVKSVVTTEGNRIESPLVINAAGPWCNQVNAWVGLEWGWTVTPTRVQIVYRDWPTELGKIPVTGDASAGIYFRTDGDGSRVLIGSITEDDETEVVDPDHYRSGADPELLDMKTLGLHHRIPALAHRGDRMGISNLYSINRDDVHPVLGPTEIEGFWVANGFSGHGFKLAPAIGSMVAQSITGEKMEFDTSVSPSFLAVDRTPLTIDAKNVLA